MTYQSFYKRIVSAHNQVNIPMNLCQEIDAQNEWAPQIHYVLYTSKSGPSLPLSTNLEKLKEYSGQRGLVDIIGKKYFKLNSHILNHLGVKKGDSLYVCGFDTILRLYPEKTHDAEMRRLEDFFTEFP